MRKIRFVVPSDRQLKIPAFGVGKNIAYGRADAREEILEAARIANVDSFVKHLDRGYGLDR